MLRPEEIIRLNTLLAQCDRESGVQLVGMIIDTLEGEDIFDYSWKVFDRLKIGRKDVNNGGLILLALKERQVRISLGNGLEWPVGDVGASLIIDDMIPLLKKEEYYAALERAFQQLIEMTGRYTWNIEDKDIASLTSIDIGKIFSFSGEFIEEKGHETQRIDDDTVEISISPSVEIIVTALEQKVILKTTPYMNPLIEMIKKNEAALITARLSNLDPLTFDLLGVRTDVSGTTGEEEDE